MTHVHALVTRGGWTASGEWVPVPYVSSSPAEQLFRHKVIRLLQHAGLLDEDRTRLLLSWHHSGFSVYNFVTVPAGDGRAFGALARYCLRNPVSLARLRWVTGSATATYQPRVGHDDEKADARNRPFFSLIPDWMAQSAMVRDYRALETGWRRANRHRALG